MLLATMYLDSSTRVRIYPEGGWQLEQMTPGIGWTLTDDRPGYADEAEAARFCAAFRQLGELCLKHASA